MCEWACLFCFKPREDEWWGLEWSLWDIKLESSVQMLSEYLILLIPIGFSFFEKLKKSENKLVPVLVIKNIGIKEPWLSDYFLKPQRTMVIWFFN